MGPRELAFDEFVKKLVELRPEKIAKVMDVSEVKKMMRNNLKQTTKQVEDLSKAVAQLGTSGQAAGSEIPAGTVGRLLDLAMVIRDELRAEAARHAKSLSEVNSLRNE